MRVEGQSIAREFELLRSMRVIYLILIYYLKDGDVQRKESL